MRKLYISTDWWDWAIAAVLSLAAIGVLLATMDIGFTRDESFYFHAAFRYIRWFEELATHWDKGDLAASFSQANIDKHWGYNPEHPVLVKTLFALSLKLFHQKLEWMSASTAMRFPGVVFAAALVGMVYLWTRQLFGRVAGVIAAGALLFQPRFFFHAHMACFDVPIVSLWFAVMYAYWRSYKSKRWALATGILWGLALATKLNAFFLPIVMVTHWALAHWPQWRIRRGLNMPRIPLAFWAMAVFGPLLFVGLWPRHWFDTLSRIEWYMTFHLKHVHYFVRYFGHNVQQPPLPVLYPWVMTLVTVPATILASFALGCVAWLTNDETEIADERGTGLLLFINLVFPLALISMPSTPIFGGVKHWMAAIPFMAMLAGAGVVWVASRARFDAVQRPLVAALVGAFMLSSAVYATLHSYRFGTGYYNELIGGTRGAADRLMMRQFWGYASRPALPWLNKHAPKNAQIYIHNTTGFAWGTYGRDSLRRKDLRATDLAHSQFSLYHHQKSFVYREIQIWEAYKKQAPVYVVDLDGVPMLSVYKK